MKRIYTLKTTLITVVIFIIGFNKSNAQVGIGNTSPQGALDISTLANPNADGLLIPRVALALTTTATVLTPTVSEMVYNTATAGDVTPGFYYWDGAKWVRLVSGTTSNDWTTTGNATTTAATNFVGTTDAIDFVTRTNNTEKTRVTSAGNVGIGTPTPAAKLDIAAGVTTVNSEVNATGSIDDFLQYNIQNTSTGTKAQSGYSATADNGTATSGFAWLGINNSGFNFPSTYNIGVANDVSYIGSGQDMYIANANNTKSIIFSTGRATPSPFFNERMRILNNGHVLVNTATNTQVDNLFEVVSTTLGDDAITGSAIGTNGIGVQGNSTVDGIGLLGSNNGGGLGILGTATGATPSVANFGAGIYGNLSQATAGNQKVAGIVGIHRNIRQGTGAYGGPASTAIGNALSGVSGTFVSKETTDSGTTGAYFFGVSGDLLIETGAVIPNRSGGVLGVGPTSATFGILGYKNSGGTPFGVYSSTAVGTGAASVRNTSSTQNNGIGIGANGGFMGGYIKGSQYGLISKGDEFGMYVSGNTVTNGPIIQLIESNSKIAIIVN